MKEAETWWDSLDAKEKSRLGMKHRKTFAYGIFKTETIIEIYKLEQTGKSRIG